jgi:hypothetical protein
MTAGDSEFWEEQRRIPRWQGGDGGRRPQPFRFRRLSRQPARTHLRPSPPVRGAVDGDGDEGEELRPPFLDPYEVLMDPGDPAFVDVGRLLWTLVATQWSWIDRRVENISLSGERSFRRHMSIDCRVPPDVADLVGELGFGRFFVPLRFVSKQPLLAFDLRLGDRSVPLMTHRQSALAAEAVLRAAVEELPHPLTPEVAAAIKLVASDEDDSAVDALELLGLTEPGRVGESATPAELAHWALTTFDTNYLLLADVGLGDIGRRTIFKVTQEVGPTMRGAQDLPLRSAIAWQPTSFVFETPSVTATSSYHFQFDAPDGLVVTGGELFGTDSRSDGPPPRRRFGSSASQGSVLGLHANREEIPVADTFSAEVLVRPSPDGLLRSSAVSSSFSTVLLVLGALMSSRMDSSRVEASTAVLLVVPGVVSTFLARPGEHYWVSRLLRGVRALTLLSAITVYLAAAVLVTGLAEGAFRGYFLGFAAVSAVPSVALVVASRRGRFYGWS